MAWRWAPIRQPRRGNSVSSWMLEDVTERAAQDPRSFFIPSSEERRSQRSGSLVKLIFVLLNPADDQPGAERMWVEVNERIEAPGEVWYRGTLTNQPQHISNLPREHSSSSTSATSQASRCSPRTRTCSNLSGSRCSSHVECWNHKGSRVGSIGRHPIQKQTPVGESSQAMNRTST